MFKVRSLFTLFGLLLLALPVASQGNEPGVSKNSRSSILLPIRLENAPETNHRLSKDSLQISHKGRPLTLLNLLTPESDFHLGVLIDSSPSVADRNKEMFANVLQGVKRFVHDSPQLGHSFVTAVRDGKVVFTAPTNERRSTLESIEQLLVPSSKGNSPVFDAIALSLNKFSSDHQVRRFLFVLSDGGDNTSKLNYSQLKNRVLESDVAIFPIFIPRDSRALIGAQSFVYLSELAAASGGEVIRLKSESSPTEIHEALIGSIESLYAVEIDTSGMLPAQKLDVRIRLLQESVPGGTKFSIKGKRSFIF